eukprot:TRINITY_DN3405_c0_g1_i1.p1 TRINITY_DN3405_c0_g1~~TRINITY_DN3405_c0_g1_i1.p1  ORF type:complete len:306 (-),score=75.87 TRINITY_DN3405_c0_g1_i1:551-1468(-)
MDEKDILFRVRNSFFLGNHHKVIDIWREISTEKFSPNIGFELYSVVGRALSLVQSNNPKLLEDVPKASKDLQEIFDAYHSYLSPLNNTITEEEARALREECDAAKSKSKMPLQMHLDTIKIYLHLAEKNFNNVLNHNTPGMNQIESLFVKLQAYLSLNRPDQAEKIFDEIKKADDEDILTHLAAIYINITKSKYDSALSLIDETKEKFEESAKLLNLKVACLISLGQIENSLSLLLKLYTFLSNKEQMNDKNELEVCLRNLITVSFILGQSSDEYVKAINELRPKNLYSEKIASASENFTQAIQG